MTKITQWIVVACAGLLCMGLMAGDAAADGTEKLDSPSLSIESGTGIVAAGTGLVSQPGTIAIDVPDSASVKQVLLYWEGQMETNIPGDDTITVNSTNVTGSLIGGSTFFFGGAYSSAFRADITSLGLVSAGPNTLTVGELVFDTAANGAGILVIYDDGSDEAAIEIRDGIDLAFINFSEPRGSTIPQTFTFAAAPDMRTATLSLFFSSVAGAISTGNQRPTSIEVTVDGVTTTHSNILHSGDGEEWDTVNLSVDIPAGTTSLTVQAFSRDDFGDGQDPLAASFAWIAAALSIVPFEEEDGPGTGTPGYWKNHPEAWPVALITIGEMTYTKAEAIALMNMPEKGDKTHTMFRALVAAKLNVHAGNDGSCIAETINDADDWMATYGPVGSGVKAGGKDSPWREGEPLYSMLDDYNNGELCAPSRDSIELFLPFLKLLLEDD